MQSLTCEISNRFNMRLNDPVFQTEDGISFFISIQNEYTHDNPMVNKLRQMKKFYAARELPQKIQTFDVIPGELVSVPRGSFRKLYSIAKKCNIELIPNDVRNSGVEVELPCTIRELESYQKDVVEMMIAKQNCLIRAPTGSGKTTAAIAFIGEIKRYTMIIVWTNGLLNQWKERVMVDLGLEESEVGIWGGGIMIEKPITIAMDQTLARNPLPEWMKEKIGIVICDEVHRFAAKTFRTVVDMFPSKYRIGMSADETRSDNLEKVIYDYFGDVQYSISQEAVDATGRTVPVDIVVAPTSFSTLSTDAHLRTIEMQKASYEPEYRNGQILDLLFNHVEGPTIIFLPRVEHCKNMQSQLIMHGVPCGLCLGGVQNRKQYDEAISGIIDGRFKVIVGTAETIGTGIDLPQIKSAILAKPVSDIRLFNQIRGRLCRSYEGKEKGIIYYLWDKNVYGKYVIKELYQKYGENCYYLNNDEKRSITELLPRSYIRQ